MGRRRSMAETKDKTCIIFENEEHSYADIKKASSHLTALLIHKGFKRGDSIGLISKKYIFSICLIAACSKLGLLCCPINDELNIQQIITD